MKKGTKRVSESGSLASVAVVSGVLTHTRSPDRRARLVPLGTLGRGCRSCGVVCPGVMKIRSISGWGRLSARLPSAPCQRQIGRNWNQFQFRVGTLWARKEERQIVREDLCLLTCVVSVVGTGVDPVTSRLSDRIRQHSGTIG